MVIVGIVSVQETIFPKKIPPKREEKPRNRLKKMFNNVLIVSPALASLQLSKAKVENVVKAPIKPTKTNILPLAPRGKRSSIKILKKPIRKHPRQFAVRVPMGNAFPP
jgi:hypothetical protein